MQKESSTTFVRMKDKKLSKNYCDIHELPSILYFDIIWKALFLILRILEICAREVSKFLEKSGTF